MRQGKAQGKGKGKDTMRIGFILPQIGPVGSPEALKKVAQRAEKLGYDSLWTTERLLYPLAPRTPYPATPNKNAAFMVNR